ncbi:TPA: hypothetical protein KOP28_004212, partial [Clostridioides difficile]|nr:hypothetical protein [Clostridioides difficile]
MGKINSYNKEMESILIFDIGGISVKNTFSEVKLFQVKPDRLDDFEKL